MQIRRAQVLQMLEADPAMLRMAIEKQVRENYADIVEGLSSDLVYEMIDNGLRAARSYGLSRAEDLAAFVLIMFEVGPEFHRHPRIYEVLADPKIESADKMQTMFERTPDRVWDEIVSVLHRQTWFPELRELDQS